MKTTTQTKTPLEQLTEMNEQAGKVRRRRAPVIRLSSKPEAYYRVQLNNILRKILSFTKTEIMPIVEEEKENFVQDSAFTIDTYSDRIIEAFKRLGPKFERIFSGQYDRLARKTLSMAESETTAAFLKSVNKAVGVDMERMIQNEGLNDYIDLSIRENVSLIKTLSEDFFKDIEQAVLNGIRTGYTPKFISRDIQERFQASQKIAHRIARDQVAKFTSDVTRQRQQSSGIKYYRVSTSKDIRVSGRPGGKYPKAKISCYNIARQDIGFGPGVYRWDEGASYGGKTGLFPGRHHIQCRCTASPVFEWELPASKRK